MTAKLKGSVYVALLWVWAWACMPVQAQTSSNLGAHSKGVDGARGLTVLDLSNPEPGFYNTFVGESAGWQNQGGANIFIGRSASPSNMTGSNHIFMGASSGTPSGSHAICIGFFAGDTSGTSSLEGAISLGHRSSAAGNKITLGKNPDLKNFFVGSVAAWPTPSDRALKTNITDSARGLSFVRQLRPVQYQFEGSADPRVGFIAQEVEQTDSQFPGLVKPQHAQDFYALQYDSFIPSLVKSVQELHGQIQTFNAPPARASGLGPLKWIAMLCALTLVCLGACLYMHMKIRAWAALPERG